MLSGCVAVRVDYLIEFLDRPSDSSVERATHRSAADLATMSVVLLAWPACYLLTRRTYPLFAKDNG